MYGRALFETNSAGMEGGAIYSLNSVINMTGRVDFNQNSAQWGGAMAFSGSSTKLRLIEPLAVNFVENSAILGGGVIFFEDDANQMCFRSQITQDCFVELSSIIISNIGLNFNNNSAERAGRIFYGGHLDTCTPIIGGWPFSDGQALNLIAGVSNVNVNVNNYNDNTTSNVSSDPLQVCICKSDGMVICDDKEIETVRGREFILPAVIVGQGLGTISSAVRISLDNNTQLGSPAQRIQPTGKACTNITYNLFAENDNTVVPR